MPSKPESGAARAAKKIWSLRAATDEDIQKWQERAEEIIEEETGCAEMYAKLDKIAVWLEKLAAKAAEGAKETRFVTLSESHAADAKNLFATAKDVRAALARARGERG